MREAWAGQVVVVGNIKGGSSKSTTVCHLVAKLLASDMTVGLIDLDVQQRSTDGFFENRAAFMKAKGHALTLPRRRFVQASRETQGELRLAADYRAFREAVDDLLPVVDVVVVDCPGADTTLSQVAHVAADLLITPLGASMVDLDLIAKFDPATRAYVNAAAYAESVAKANIIRQTRDVGRITWSVVLNRYDARQPLSESRVWRVLEMLSKPDKLGFELLAGIAQRPVYSDLWPYGLTVLDVKAPDDARALDFEAARGEINRLFAGLSARLAGDQREAIA
jgi:chromosome partitioning protein